MSDFVLQATRLEKSYREGGRALSVLKGVDLSLQPGERVTIMGSSGSGKSTLLNLLGGLDVADSGSVNLKGHNLTTLNSHERDLLRNKFLGFVYQFHHLLREFTAIENAAMPLLIRGLSQGEALKQAASMLDKVGLSERYDHKPSELSGGERQRVAVARALIGEPALVLMDEPTGNLDEANAQSVRELIEALSTGLGTAFVIVTHDQQMAASMDTHYLLHDGRLNRES